MTIGINGMAHVILTVSRFEVAPEFYRKLLPECGMKPVFDGDGFFHCRRRSNRYRNRTLRSGSGWRGS